MLFNILVLGTVLIIAYVLGGQGFFSSLLHMVCVIAAGAITFAAWEPVVYLLAPKIGSDAVADLLWGVGIIGIFTLSLLVLRLITEKVCGANIHFSVTVNTIGGWACGIVSGLLTAGILTLGAQMIPGPQPLAGYQGWALSSQSGQGGAIIRQQSLWLPVDTLTAKFYSMASETSMWSPNSLSTWHPQLDQQASLLRLSFDGGKSRQIARPGDVSVSKIIRLDDATVTEELKSYLGAQDPTTMSSPTSGEVLLLRTEVRASAWDDGSYLRLGKSQIRLIVETYAGSGEFVAIHPHAFYQIFETNLPAEHRFTFSDADTWAVSVGSASEAKFSFEFLTPKGAIPHHLIVRNARADLPPVEATPLTRKQVESAAAKGTW